VFFVAPRKFASLDDSRDARMGLIGLLPGRTNGKLEPAMVVGVLAQGYTAHGS
jgi:hypothetical protein